MKFTAEYKQNLLNRLKMAKSYKETICIDPDVVTQLLQEREQMVNTLRFITANCWAHDVENNTMLWGKYNEFIQKSRATLKQVGELE